MIDLVSIVIAHPRTGEALVNHVEPRKSGTFTDSKEWKACKQFNAERIPSTRKRVDETYVEALNRLLENHVGAPAGSIEFDRNKLKRIDSEVTSEYFPGLTTIVRKRIFSGSVITTDKEVLASLGVIETAAGLSRSFRFQSGMEVHEWTWKSWDNAPELAR